jgi:pterin-4a-carbinolamine dehydratase
MIRALIAHLLIQHFVDLRHKLDSNEGFLDKIPAIVENEHPAAGIARHQDHSHLEPLFLELQARSGPDISGIITSESSRWIFFADSARRIPSEALAAASTVNSAFSNIMRAVSFFCRVSSHQLFHHPPMYVRKSKVAAGITIGKILMVEAQQPQ